MAIGEKVKTKINHEEYFKTMAAINAAHAAVNKHRYEFLSKHQNAESMTPEDCQDEVRLNDLWKTATKLLFDFEEHFAPKK